MLRGAPPVTCLGLKGRVESVKVDLSPLTNIVELLYAAILAIVHGVISAWYFARRSLSTLRRELEAPLAIDGATPQLVQRAISDVGVNMARASHTMQEAIADSGTAYVRITPSGIA